MRLYDAVMALLSIADADAAAQINAIHTQGQVTGSLPFINLEEDST